MHFRTEVDFLSSAIKMEKENYVFSIGSCFATEISGLLEKGQIQTLNNPFGTIFNPYSIANAVKRIHDSDHYKEEDLIVYNDNFISLDHHSSFNADYAHKTLEKINLEIEKANQFLQNTNFVIITLGTSYIYQFIPKEKLVANCHKIPSKHFEKRFLTHLELCGSIAEMIKNLKDICKNEVQILFTVSPVRHTKDGIIENQLSKAKLLNAVHEFSSVENCHYLPIYEMMMDDLRDYRFYKEDMIHPNNQAINYIFEKFGNAYFSDDMMDFIEENFKINQSLNHKPSDEKSTKHQQFLVKLNERIALQQSKVKHRIFTKCQ